MTEQYEQRYCIKFCQKLGDTQVETIRKIQQAFGHDAMSNSWIKEWYNRFEDGRTSVDSEPRSGRPSTSRNENVIEQVRTLVMEDRCITVRKLANETGVSIGSVHSILTEDLLHHDNAPANSAHLIQTFVTKHNIPVVRQASYSPDMAPCDFWLFPKLIMSLKGT
ncbi:hypothetical protein B7P43_G03209 [Cryptotermes secundus]|uniref:Mos1 transposase HTH domain-containing protein n=1 Tax=Cryptotermes secundus TaxID=105785 RepID=A0A2J7RRY0_9NEOP|nr:hypothetical protein B7P43_G03209 [Cryptotermes secundus]